MESYKIFPCYSLDRREDGTLVCQCKDGTACSTPGKHPRISNNLNLASSDSKQIKAWREQFGDSDERRTINWGIPTGATNDHIAVDADARYGGLESLKRLQEDYGELPEGPLIATGNGKHLIFALPGVALKSNDTSFGDEYPGLDIRAEGGYRMAPGSLHHSGATYVQLHDGPPPPLPGWAIKLLTGGGFPKKQRAKEQSGAATDGRVQKGSRDNRLASLAGTMVAKGIPKEGVLAALLEFNRLKCDPPLPERDVRRIACSVSRYQSQAMEAGEDPRDRYFDRNLAERFAALHGETVKYLDSGSWASFANGMWIRSEDGAQFQLGEFLKAQAPPWPAEDAGAALLKWVKDTRRHLASARCQAAVRQLAACQPLLQLRTEQFDADSMLLGCPGGMVIDLKTGEHRNSTPEDLVSKSVVVSPGGSCPRWLQFLEEITAGDKELQSYLQRAAGYSLTASTREEVLLVLYGPGGNGKGTFVGTLIFVLGPYAHPVGMDALVEKKFGNDYAALNAVAKLCGVRLAVASEQSKSKKLDTALINNLTGGDKLVGKFMGQDMFEFNPTHKLWLLTNFKPQLEIDDATRRRLHLVPFLESFEKKKDTALKDTLKKEAPGILLWAIEGCREWQENGLRPPAAVLNFTNEYLNQADPVLLWVEARAEKDPKVFESTDDLWGSWRNYCEATKADPGNLKSFREDLEKHKEVFREGKATAAAGGKQRRGFWGVRLKFKNSAEQETLL